MRPLRLAVGGAALIDSLVAILSWSRVVGSSAAEGMGVVGAALLVDACLCLYGARFAFYGAALLSIVELAVALLGGSFSSWESQAVAILSAVTLGLSVLAIRTEENIPEQANPMNLPVFG
jgi:hypothetical protein